MSDLNVVPQQTPFELNVLIEPPLSGSGHEASVLEQHDIPPDAFSLFYILGRPLSRFLRSHLLTRHPSSGDGYETDQYLGGISTYPHLWFRIPAQDLIQFLKHDAFTEQPSFAGGNETLAEQNGMPSYFASLLIPAASLYQFLQPYALPGSEPRPSGNRHKISVEQNGTPDYNALLLIPAGSLNQFLQLHEIPESRPSGSGNETPAEHQLYDGSGDDAISVSVTPTQSQDSDQVNAQPNGGRASILRRCPVCRGTFRRVQERNRHVESYLPHSICCQLLDCCWTGRRQWDFKEHWRRKHPEAKQAPGEDANEIYDPKDFVKLIVDGTPIDEVARSAFAKVQESLERLGKLDVGAKVLGRSKDLRKWISTTDSDLIAMAHGFKPP